MELPVSAKHFLEAGTSSGLPAALNHEPAHDYNLLKGNKHKGLRRGAVGPSTGSSDPSKL
jgi:hypothetical protein